MLHLSAAFYGLLGICYFNRQICRHVVQRKVMQARISVTRLTRFTQNYLGVVSPNIWLSALKKLKFYTQSKPPITLSRGCVV